MKRAIWWIKRDFRLSDNQALSQALLEQDEVLPLFVFETRLIQQPDSSPMHVWAWQQALVDLQAQLRSKQADVLIAYSDMEPVLTALHQKWPFQALYSHQETGNAWTFARDRRVAQWCQNHQVRWHEFSQTGVIRGLRSREDRTAIIQSRLLESKVLPVPSVLRFPSFWEKVCAQRKVPKLSQFFDASQYQAIAWDQLQKVGETQAKKDLESFLKVRGKGYSGGISSPNTAFEHGSRLSVHLAWGTISLRTVFQQSLAAIAEHKTSSLESSKQWGKSLRAFTARLHWHDHFIQRLESAPNMEFAPLNPAYESIQYEDNPQKLTAWKNGETGFPMIDACMRCLQATGFLNFRMRAMVVNFAVFGLHLSWKTIHPPLARIFLDYEPGIHLSQLQMQAGIVGINTVRVYSPTKQILDQDPEAKFIKRWIPQLQSFTTAEIINYEKIALGSYPPPIVDFRLASAQMKEQIFTVKKSVSGKLESAKVLQAHGSRKRRASSKKYSPQKSLF